MQHVERDFGVPLFIRGKNKLELNETGIEAVRYAKNFWMRRRILSEWYSSLTKTDAR